MGDGKHIGFMQNSNWKDILTKSKYIKQHKLWLTKRNHLTTFALFILEINRRWSTFMIYPCSYKLNLNLFNIQLISETSEFQIVLVCFLCGDKVDKSDLGRKWFISVYSL